MSNPTRFEPGFSYSGFQAVNPTKPLPAPQIDNDFANISLTTNEIIDALGDIRRGDGKLVNNSVTIDALDPETKAHLVHASSSEADKARAAANEAAVSADLVREYVVPNIDAILDAPDHAENARLWASAEVGVVVNDGVNPVGHSAHHWSEKSREFAEAAAMATIPEGSVEASMLADGSVTMSKLADEVSATIASKADGQSTEAALADRYTKGDTDAMLNEVAVAVADALDKKHDIGDPVLDMGGTVLSAQPGGVAVEHAGGTQSATFHYDGNIHGSVWGGYLSSWLNAQNEALRQWAYASFMTDIRLTGWWEGGLGANSWNNDPGGGTVITGLYAAGQTSGGAAIAHRGGRYLQKCIGGQWYSVGTWG